MRKKYKGAVRLGYRLIIFPNTKNWRLGSYHIGATIVLMIGPSRIFIHEKGYKGD